MLKNLILYFLLSTPLWAQQTVFTAQLNPKGLALHPTGVHVFPDASALVNTASKYILKYSLLNDSTWTNNKMSRIYCEDCLDWDPMSVANPQVFRKGNQLTKDGGKNWSTIDPAGIINFSFNDSAHWVYQRHDSLIYESFNQGISWSTDGHKYRWLGSDEGKLHLLSNTNGNLYQLTKDSLSLLLHWPSRFPNLNFPWYYHQVDSFNCVFEQNSRMYTYNPVMDSLWMVPNVFLSRPASRVYTDGDDFIREDNLGNMVYFLNSAMNWVSRAGQFNSPSFDYSAGRLFYLSYLPQFTFNVGSLGLLYINNNHKELWGGGGSYNTITTKIKRTDNDSLFYATGGQITDAEGRLVGSHPHSYFPSQVVKPNIWIDQDADQLSTDYGQNWLQRPSNTYEKPNTNFNIHHQFMTQAEDQNCFVDVWGRPGQASHLGFYSNGSTQYKDLGFFNNVNVRSLYFKSCDTGVVIFRDSVWIVDRSQNRYQKFQSNLKFGEFSFHGNYYYLASADYGLFRSTDLMNWLSYRLNFPYAPEVILKNRFFFRYVKNKNLLFYSLDEGRSLDSLVLPANIQFMDKANDSTLILSGPNGTVWHAWVGQMQNVNQEEWRLNLRKEADFSLYPNPAPAGGNISIKVNEPKTEFSCWEIRSLQGAPVQKGTVDESLEIKVPATVASGSYILMLITVKGRVINQMLYIL
jgi:hypothetical protein